MSYTRWFVYASFAGGILALSLQLSGAANAATVSPVVRVADYQSSSSSMDGQRDMRRGKTGTADAESSGKMQSERDASPGSQKMNPNSRSDGKSSQGQGSEVDPGLPTPSIPESIGSSPSSGNSSSMGGGSGTSGGGTGGGGQ